MRSSVAEGADVVLLSPDELTRRFPWLATDGDRPRFARVLGRRLVRRLRARPGTAQARRASLARSSSRPRSSGWRWTAVAWSRLALADGASWPCGAVVNAAGPWAAEVAAMAGVDLPVEARRRSVFVLRLSSATPRATARSSSTPRASWFRPEGGVVHRGHRAATRARPGRPAARRRTTACSMTRLWPALARRVPAFDAIRVHERWAGYYEVNTFDHNAIIGRASGRLEPAVRQRLQRPRHPAGTGRRARPSPS